MKDGRGREGRQLRDGVPLAVAAAARTSGRHLAQKWGEGRHSGVRQTGVGSRAKTRESVCTHVRALGCMCAGMQG